MSDSPRPIPPTPGYHPAPGNPPAHRATPGVPATPGYHSPSEAVANNAPLSSTAQKGDATAKNAASPSASAQCGAPTGGDNTDVAGKTSGVAPGKTTASRPNLGNLVSKLSDQVQALVKGEIELAKVKATNMAKRSGVGIALLVVAGVLALYMLGFLFGAVAEALVLAVPMWAAKLIVAGILLVLVAILALVGKASLQKGIADKPDPQAGIKEGIAAVKKGLE